MRAPPTYTYYAGFEYEFKKITKKYGKKTYFEIEYADEISKYKKDNVHDSDSENNSDLDCESSDSDDDFDNIKETNKKIKKKSLETVKEQYLFYYQIIKRMDDKKKKYDCNIVLLDSDLKSWLENVLI